MNAKTSKKSLWNKWLVLIGIVIIVTILFLAVFFSVRYQNQKQAKQLATTATQRYQQLIHTKGLPSFDTLLKTLSTLKQAKIALQYSQDPLNKIKIMQTNCLNKLFLPMLDYYYKRSLVANFKHPQKLYRLLKTYLMLGNIKRLNSNDFFWTTKQLLPSQKLPHFKQFLKLATKAPFKHYPIDQRIVIAARQRFASFDAEQQANAVLSSNLTQSIIVYQNAKWFKPTQTTIPALYTKKQFKTASSRLISNASHTVLFGNWVLGKRQNTRIHQAELNLLVYNDYLTDYVNQWSAILSTIHIDKPQSLSAFAKLLTNLSGQNSALIKILKPIHQNTDLPQVDALSAPLAKFNTLFSPQSLTLSTIQKN